MRKLTTALLLASAVTLLLDPRAWLVGLEVTNGI